MPEVARFFGIIVRMYAEAGEPHHRPHLHAYAGESTAVVAIDGLEVIAGGLPRRQERLLLAWVELHGEELLMNWRRLQEGRPTSGVPLIHGMGLVAAKPPEFRAGSR